MGGISSCCMQRELCDNDDPGHRKTSTPKKKSRHGRTLSATFNLTVIEDATRKRSLVNINTANEEELMTLPGISRNIAKSIIDYRNHIGGYRRVEDVTLVSGVGAEKLSLIRSDICVTDSTASAACGDMSVVSTSEINDSAANVSKDSNLIVCVNSANIFSLLRVKGVGMAIAKNIVAYRDAHGRFSKFSDLLKVKGVGPGNLQVMQQQLVLDNTSLNGGESNGHCHNGNACHSVDEKTVDKKMQRPFSSSMEDLLKILGPLAKVPTRPNVEQVSFKLDNRHIFRLASWNLKNFSLAKAQNPGVKDAVCMTVLENGFGIVCIQELSDIHSLKEICDELNEPTLPNNKKWGGHRGQWTCEVSKPTGKMFQGTEYNGFLYDKSQGISLCSSCVLEKARQKNQQFFRKPFMGVFSVRSNFELVVVSVHLKASGLSGKNKDRTEAEAESVNDLMHAVQDMHRSQHDIVILGDFNLNPDAEAFDKLKEEGYTACIPATTYTNISISTSQGSSCYDNIWISRQTQKVYTGVSGVVREGLSNAWIPNGWTWGGAVSDHCPVYTQLYV